MATGYPPGAALARTAIRSGLTVEAERAVRAYALAGSEPTDALYVIEDANAQRGWSIKTRFLTVNHSTIPDPRGVSTIGTEGSREPVEDTLNIRYFQLAKGAIENLTADQNAVDFDLLAAEHTGMTRETSEILEKGVMNQLCGNVLVNDTATYPDYGLSMGNAAVNPDTDHHHMCGGETTEAGVAGNTSAVLTNREVENVTKKMRSLRYVDYPIPPASTPWGELYVCFCSGDGMEQLKENNTDSDIYDLSKAEIQGGMDPKLSTLMTGEGFIKSHVLYLESDYITNGLSGATQASAAFSGVTSQANCHRAVVLGAQAMHMRYGMNYTDGLHLGYVEHRVMRKLHMVIDTVYGGKVSIVNNQRWASFVVSHYAAA